MAQASNPPSPSSPRRNTWLVATVLAVLVGLGTWYALTRAHMAPTNDNVPVNVTNTGTPGALTISGTALRYDSSGGAQYALAVPEGWSLSRDGAVVHASNAGTGAVITAEVRAKASTLALSDFVTSQTTGAPVVEGSYERPEQLTIHGIPAVSIKGSYVTTFVQYFFLLSDTEVLVASSPYRTSSELQNVTQVITAISKT